MRDYDVVGSYDAAYGRRLKRVLEEQAKRNVLRPNSRAHADHMRWMQGKLSRRNEGWGGQ